MSLELSTRRKSKKLITMTKNWPREIVSRQKGQMALIVVLALLSTTSALAVGLGILTFNEVKKLNNVVKTSQSYYTSEGGLEDAIIRIKNNMNYPSSYTLTVGEGVATVTVSGPSDNLMIISEGDVANRIRKVSVNLVTAPSITDIDFIYGVQVDVGGIIIENNAVIIGNTKTNGSIDGSNGANVTGTAIAVDTINNLNIGIDGWADVINSSTITGIKFCQTTNDAPACDTSQGIPTPSPLPITPAEISAWKAEAASGGECGPPKCDASGNYILGNGDTDSIGPIKITGDFLLEENSTLTITGTIWVEGTMTFDNGTVTQLHSGYGSTSGVIVTDGDIATVKPGAELTGSGDPDSFIMLLSDKNALTSNVISLGNNSSGAVYYAGTGRILVSQNAGAMEITAYGMTLEQNATVTYVSGLADESFASGPGGVFKIKSWQEIE